MSQSSLQPPPAFTPGNSPADEWTRWKKRFQIYTQAIVLGTKTVEQQRATLLHVIGDSALDIYYTFGYEESATEPTLQAILNRFDEHYRPFKNTTYKRYVFFTLNQKPGQSIDDYVTDLKMKSLDCEFENLAESLIRDRIVVGITDMTLKERLLQEPELTLAKTIDLARAAEQSQNQLRSIQVTSDTASVHVLTSSGKYSNQNPSIRRTMKNYTANEQYNNNETKLGESRNSQSEKFQQSAKCSRCGYSHKYGQCPAFGKSCLKCGKQNHFASVCKQQKQQRQVCYLNQELETEDLVLDSITVQVPLHSLSTLTKPKQWIQDVLLNGYKVGLKLDTGSQANILPYSIYETWKEKPVLQQSVITVLTYTGQSVPVEGQCNLMCEVGKSKEELMFLVVRVKATAILGLSACVKLGLIAKLQVDSMQTVDLWATGKSAAAVIEKYQDVFQGLGELPGCHTIQLKEGALPKIQAARRIPQSLREPVRQELDRMESLGIIAKVTEPTDWVHPMVVVKKPDNSVRICIDPRELNTWIRREHYQMPNPESVLAQIPEAEYYSVMDAQSAFWQIKIDDNSSKVLTMATPFGRYRFLRLPYGICSAPEVFQRTIHDLYERSEEIVTYLDDLITWGDKIDQHNKNLEKVLQLARSNGLKLSKKKLQLAQKTVSFVGHTISSAGISADPNKIDALGNLKVPEDKTGLQRFLGTITYLAKFIPNLSNLTSPLRQLLKNDVEWCWDENAQTCFEQLKKVATAPPVLRHFDPNKPLTLSVDASQHGLGAVLIQEGQPLAYASAALTDTQCRYAQIEKEMLALWFGCQRFYYYLYGRHFKAHTDHKPLISIIKKPLEAISPRLQRLVLKLQRYDMELIYIPGKELLTADLLSRDSSTTDTVDTKDIDEQAHLLTLRVVMNSDKGRELAEATKEDSEMQQLKRLIQEGWPAHLNRVPTKVQAYWNCQNELHIWNNLICRGERLVIPKGKREWVLNCVHSAHQGIVNCKARAREAVYWPGMSGDIEKTIGSCEVCQQFATSNQKEPLQSHTVPTRPWEKVGVDMFHFDGVTYVLVIDYYSKYPEMIKVGSTAAANIIPALMSVFSRHGIPDTVITDNGPPFSSDAFTSFAKEWNFSHTTSSPNHPQSNGMVERTVQTVKQLLRKAREDGGDPYMSLLILRSTPHNGLPSPAQLLMGRRLKTLLPTKDSLLKPKTIHEREVRKKLKENQERQQRLFNRSTKPLSTLSPGQKVKMQTAQRSWIPATVSKPTGEPRSYEVVTKFGSLLRRNRIHLRPTGERCISTSGTAEKLAITPVPIETGSKPTQEISSSASVDSPKRLTHSNRLTRSGREVHTPARYKT